MNATELLRYQIDDAGYQLEQVLKGLPEDAVSYRVTDSSMTVREQVVHLCEAYFALTESLAGREHQWGSYSLADKSWEEVNATLLDLRAKATEGVLDGKEEDLKKGHMFILAHDYYHVGQIASARIVKDPAWDAYSIYKM